MYSRILIPMDGSDVAAQALPHARAIAQATGAGISLVQVVPSIQALMNAVAIQSYEGFDQNVQRSALSYEQWEERHKQVRDNAIAQLKAPSDALQKDGLRVEALVREGEPAEAIALEARQQDGTLIAMTTHGRSGIGRWLMGSVTDKVVREAGSPVLVIRAQKSAATTVQFQRIILPLDGSPLAEEAIPAAVALSKGLKAPVTLLRSISLAAYGYGFSDYSVPEYSMSDFADGVRKDVKDYLDRAAEKVQQQGAAGVEISAPDGQPADTILAEAESGPNGIIVMTTHGRSGIGRWVMGSVTDRVVRHADAPVLIVPSSDK